MNTPLFDTCIEMAKASRADADDFWPRAPLYALERSVAADVWAQAALGARSGATLDAFLLTAGSLEREAENARSAGRWADATVARVKADTWRRVVRILTP